MRRSADETNEKTRCWSNVKQYRLPEKKHWYLSEMKEDLVSLHTWIQDKVGQGIALEVGLHDLTTNIVYKWQHLKYITSVHTFTDIPLSPVTGKKK